MQFTQNKDEMASSVQDDLLEWKEIIDDSLTEWEVKLETSGCNYHQFPFWARSFRCCGYTPRFFYLGTLETPVAFAAIIEVGDYPFRSALVDRGPFFFDLEETEIRECIESFIQLMRKLRYVFIRFSRGQDEIFARIKTLPYAALIEPFPFCRDSQNALIVDIAKNDDQLLSGFNATIRNEIRRGRALQYEIRTGNSDLDFELAWNLFEELAFKKGFQLSSKPKDFWKELLIRGSSNSLARLYLCSYDGTLIAAQIVVRDGEVAELMLAARNAKCLEIRPGPAALLNWTAMQDCRDLGCGYYNLGGPGDPKRNNLVYEFKKKFRPELLVAPEPVCLILSRVRFWIWTRIVLRGWRVWRKRFKRRRTE
ncbi:MAG: GNAT family N-acetyltransferase [Pyrinomonadaceae bacterium]